MQCCRRRTPTFPSQGLRLTQSKDPKRKKGCLTAALPLSRRGDQNLWNTPTAKRALRLSLDSALPLPPTASA